MLTGQTQTGAGFITKEERESFVSTTMKSEASNRSDLNLCRSNGGAIKNS